MKFFISFLLFVVALPANAASLVLYDGNSNDKPLMEASTRTFPEPPEYYANWDMQWDLWIFI
jgi:hypothetical protein